jgi:predicted dehydrogenase
MNKISWGIIGCGDVTELKSGPAFNKVPFSKLHAVMRRDVIKAADYAKRHNVPVYYADANDLINDPEVNAIYIATPPSSHEQYALKAIEQGKFVYVEKPMTIDYASSLRLLAAVEKYNAKCSVAHYRNEQPFYKSIKQLLDDNIIGRPQTVTLRFYRPPLNEVDLKQSQKAWRVDPSISGGGLFHDLAPHQLASMLQFFGVVAAVSGEAKASSDHYKVDDVVNGKIEFANGVVFSGEWNFNAKENIDECFIVGAEGMIQFSFFADQRWLLTKGNETLTKHFDPPLHVQQPMIEKVVKYFLGEATNPCPVHEGVEVMRLIQAITKPGSKV